MILHGYVSLQECTPTSIDDSKKLTMDSIRMGCMKTKKMMMMALLVKRSVGHFFSEICNQIHLAILRTSCLFLGMVSE